MSTFRNSYARIDTIWTRGGLNVPVLIPCTTKSEYSSITTYTPIAILSFHAFLHTTMIIACSRSKALRSRQSHRKRNITSITWEASHFAFFACASAKSVNSLRLWPALNFTQRLKDIINNHFELSDISALSSMSFRTPNIRFNATTPASLTSAASLFKKILTTYN